MRNCEKLDHESFKDLTKGGQVLTKDYYGDKVIKLGDGRIVKLFRLKRFFSSALVRPYAGRFVRAAALLEKKGIPTVKVEGVYRVPPIKRDMVLYHPLEGTLLREAFQNTGEKTALVKQFAAFLADLHAKGIYFRSIHLNNVILTPEGGFGLIDISDLHYWGLPLTISKRVRNFRPIFKCDQDRKIFEGVSIEFFLDCYVENAGFKSKRKGELMSRNVLNQYF